MLPPEIHQDLPPTSWQILFSENDLSNITPMESDSSDCTTSLRTSTATTSTPCRPEYNNRGSLETPSYKDFQCAFGSPQFLDTQKKQDLSKLYHHHQHELQELNISAQPMNELDFCRANYLKKQVMMLQEKLARWALINIDEELSLTQNDPVPPFVHADYVVNKRLNESLEKALENRKKALETKEERIDFLERELARKVEELQASREATASNKKNTACNIQELQKEVNFYKSSCDSSIHRCERIEQKFAAVTKELAEAKQKIGCKEAELTFCKNGLIDAETKLQQIPVLREELLKTRKKLNGASRTIRNKDQRLKKTHLSGKDCRKIIFELRKANRLQKKKILNLIDIVNDLKKNKIVSEEYADAMEKLPASVQSILRRVTQKEKISKGELYNKDIRSFAISLYHYSPAGYEYVRTSFRGCLPHKSTIQGWLATVVAEPGFEGEARIAIKARTARAREMGLQILVSLAVDEMSLKKLIEYNGKEFMGYVDIGENAPFSKPKEQANHALVFMIVGLNLRLRMPCGYFFIKGLTGPERGLLLTNCIKTLEEDGVEVHNVTFDGTQVNITMVESLGCELDDVDNMVTSFENPADPTRRVNVTPDAVHMLKLVRNTLGDKDLIIDKDGGRIEWKFITNLHTLQMEEGLHFANKLSTKHVEFWKNKMKVKLAAQTLSSSVADAIEYLDKKRHMDAFSGSEATVKFIRMVILNFKFKLLLGTFFANFMMNHLTLM
jgi:Transposase protein